MHNYFELPFLSTRAGSEADAASPTTQGRRAHMRHYNICLWMGELKMV